jgi:hypothetical protein
MEPSLADHASTEQEKQFVRDKCARFVKWCADVGIVCPKIEYPGFFDGGLVGALVKQPIKHREAFLFVPFDVIISVDKCHRDPLLGPIYTSHPDLFSEENYDWEQLTLTVFLMRERQKGQLSFWAPYIDLMPDVTFFCDLPQKEILATNDAFVVKELKTYKKELEEQFQQIQDCLQLYPAVFPSVERKVFM